MNEHKTATPDLSLAIKTLIRYKREKAELESRIASESDVWRAVYTGGDSSSWIFNSIVNKHADIIDSIPSCVCLPREKRDEKYAETLSKIIPVITQRCCFEQTYSDNCWEKLKHGTAAYGVFWNNALEDGLGDIDIRALSMEDIYWEIGAIDIQDSKNLFIVSLCDVEALEATYGVDYSELREQDSALASSLGMSAADGKCVVVDWYYKKYLSDGSAILHLCKFIGDRILYSSESDPSCAEGWYEHGQYPIIFDRMYPTGLAYGFGIIATSVEAQRYINRIDDNILEYADWASRVRFWAKRSLGVNEKEFLDLDRSIVEVEGDIDEEKLRQIEISPINDSVMEAKLLKIEELKTVTGSLDVSQGGITNGVTAASAISILREAGAKTSRDGIEETYRAYVKMITFVIELIRQFYDETRVFRIIGEDGSREYLDFSGKSIRADENGRRPHFDIEINAVKKAPSESEKKNQFAKQLYESGAFRPENAAQTLLMLEMMDFEGVGMLKASIRSLYGDGKEEKND